MVLRVTLEVVYFGFLLTIYHFTITPYSSLPLKFVRGPTSQHNLTTSVLSLGITSVLAFSWIQNRDGEYFPYVTLYLLLTWSKNGLEL